MFELGQKVWVIKHSKNKKNVTEKRKGMVKYINDYFVGVRVQAQADPKVGWVECFLYNDLITGQVVINERSSRGRTKPHTVTAVAG